MTNAAVARIGLAQRATGMRVLARDNDHLVFTYDRLFTMVWRHETHAAAVSRAMQLLDTFAESLTPKRFCLLTVVEPTAPLPPSAARAALARLLRINADYLIRSAVGYEGAGFRAAAVRGVATGIAVLSNHQFPHRIFAGVEPATEWLASGLANEMDGQINGTALADVVHSVRRMAR